MGVFLIRLHSNEHTFKHETQTLDFTKTDLVWFNPNEISIESRNSQQTLLCRVIYSIYAKTNCIRIF